jgi:hypothetical protein
MSTNRIARAESVTRRSQLSPSDVDGADECPLHGCALATTFRAGRLVTVCDECDADEMARELAS